MKKTFILFIFLGFFVLSSWLLKQNNDYKKALWLDETPKILEISPNSFSAVFMLDSPATIYWRILSKETKAPSYEDFTNTNLEGVIAYGGSFSQSREVYTNKAAGLAPETDYILYAVAVPRIGFGQGCVKKIAFQTKALLINQP